MKRSCWVVMVVMILLLLTECVQPIWEFDEIPDLGIQTVQDAMNWVYWEIQWVSDDIHYPVDEYWQSPAQTYVWRSGDCEDFCILVLYLIHRDVNIDGRMCVGTLWGEGHAWVWVDGHFWEPQAAWIVDNNLSYQLQRSISYDEVIKRSTTTHKRLEVE